MYTKTQNKPLFTGFSQRKENNWFNILLKGIRSTSSEGRNQHLFSDSLQLIFSQSRQPVHWRRHGSFLKGEGGSRIKSSFSYEWFSAEKKWHRRRVFNHIYPFMNLLFKVNHRCGSSFMHLNYWLAEWEGERDYCLAVTGDRTHTLQEEQQDVTEEIKKDRNWQECLSWNRTAPVCHWSWRKGAHTLEHTRHSQQY